MKQAVIDLGTNTFHLLIREKAGDAPYQTVFQASRPAKIGRSAGGEGGISRQLITEEAVERALGVLGYFGKVLAEEGIDPAEVAVYGTSAIRVARNQQAFVDTVYAETGLRIRVISGDEEAELIYRGVLASGAIPPEKMALVVDIGGGSVEFIIGTTTRVYWKQSIEVGGQRLMERFMPEAEVISPVGIVRLHTYLREQLLPLTNAVHQYQPELLVGSSGSFDTLIDLYAHEQTGTWPPSTQAAFNLQKQAFDALYTQLVERNRAGRMAMPGMTDLRVDMIVVAVCLIDFLLTAYNLNTINVSTYSLKEGALV